MHRLLRFLILLALSLPLAAGAFAQDGRIEGTVLDRTTGEPLPGATVQIAALGVGAATAPDGSYALTGIPAGDHVVRVSFVGYEATERLVEMTEGATVTLNLELGSSLSELDEVVVTALGIERETRSLGYAVQEVDGSALERANEANVVNALAGKVAGVQITSSSGQPGSSARIVIRGNSSFLENNQPLFIVDGVPISNEEDLAAGDGLGAQTSELFNGGASNRVLDIDPNTIEEVTVLKGASATALYGSRAANGAVVIKTKSGIRGQRIPRVTLNSRVRFDETIIDGFQNEYLQGQNGFFQNGLPAERGGYFDPEGTSITGAPLTSGRTTLSWGPHRDEVPQRVLDDLGVDAIEVRDPRDDFYQTGTSVENNLSLAGGLDQVNYFLSVSDVRNEGAVPGTELDRTSILAKADIQITDAFGVRTSVNHIRTQNQWLAEGNGNRSYLYGLNFAPISFDLREPTFPDGSQRFNTSVFNNPLWLADNNSFNSDVSRFIASTEASYQILPGLRVQERVGIDTYGDSRKEKVNVGTVGFQDGETYDQQITRTEINSDFTVTYDRDVTEDVGVNVLLGNNINSRTYQTELVRAEDLNIPGFFNVASANFVTGEEESEERLLVAAYGQLSADFRDYVYLTLTGRNDWSSTLPVDNNSYFYPSASLGFVFSEAFGSVFDGTPLTFGRLRASIAQVGNDAPVYTTQTNFFRSNPGDGQRGNINFPFDGRNGFELNNVQGNANLKPEITTEYELGLDLRFLGERARIDAAFYDRSTRDQIFQVPVSPTTGFVSRVINAGEIRNYGWELSVGGSPIVTPSFEWDLQMNWSKNVTEVVELAAGVENIEIDGFTSPDIRILPEKDGYGVIFGSRYARNDDGRLLIDDDGFPIIDNELGAIGRIQPDWTGNLRSTLRYKGASLSALLDVREGGDILNFDQFYTTFYGTAEVTEDRGTEFVYDGIVASSGEENTTSIVRDEFFYRALYSSVFENFVEDGSFVKLREVSLSYAIPQSLLQRARLRTAQITLTGRNLWIDTDFSYGDPEGSLFGSGNAQGFYHAVTPGTRSYSVGLQIGI